MANSLYVFAIFFLHELGTWCDMYINMDPVLSDFTRVKPQQFSTHSSYAVPASRELSGVRAAQVEATFHNWKLQQQLTAEQAARQQLDAAQCEHADQEQKVGPDGPCSDRVNALQLAVRRGLVTAAEASLMDSHIPSAHLGVVTS